MIKVDVDGIEHLILAGAKAVLKNPTCRTVLIEINDDFTDQATTTTQILLECGFVMTEKHYQAGSIFNQIWEKM